MLDIRNKFDVADYHTILYGVGGPSALKTRVIPTKESDADPRFQATQHDQFDGLLQKGIFSFVPRSDGDGDRIYTSRFVHEIKKFGTPWACSKSRFVLFGHSD